MSATSERELYFISGSPPCWTAMLAMAVKGLAYTPRRLDNAKREQKSPEFLAVNPRGQVPVLVEGGNTVCETLAVLAYLDAAYPTPPLFGSSPAETARVWQSLSECDAYLRERVSAITRPLFRGKGEAFAEQIAEAAEPVRAELARLETTLSAEPWLAGAALSAADLTTYPVVMQLMRAAGREEAAPHALGVYPLAEHFQSLAAWAGRIEALPGYEDAYPPHWK